jgi:nucleoside-diphosphate-sugar epimerase
MNILVTGVAGFIGSHLAEALIEAGHSVIGIDNFDNFYCRETKEKNLQKSLNSPLFHFIEGDAGEHRILDALPLQVDTVIHLAAKAGVQPSLNHPQDYIHANISVTNTILEWMRKRNIRKLVFASSSSVYGNNKTIPFSENDEVTKPISPYAFTKRSCELMNYTYHCLYELDIVNLRFFTVYGERQRPDLAIRKFVNNIYNGKPITVYGNGESARDYTYFSDIIAGIIASVHFINSKIKVYETFNLGNSHPVSLIELINMISSLTNTTPTLVYESSKAGDVDITFANIEKANSMLGYSPKVKLEDGIRNFIHWYQQNETTQKFSLTGN